MANILFLNQPYVSVGLSTYTFTIPSTGLYTVNFQSTLPQAYATGDGAGSGQGLGSGKGGGDLGGFALGGATPVAAQSAVQASLVNQAVTYTAVSPGEDGNDISIELIDPGMDGSLSIHVSGDSISVTLASSSGITTTASSLVTALLANGGVTALITPSGSGSTPLTALSPTFLAGGLDAVPESGEGSAGYGFGPDNSGYEQPLAAASNATSGPAVESSLVVLVKQNGSTKLTAPAIAAPGQSSLNFKFLLNCTAADTIEIDMTSSNADDNQLNSMKSSAAINQGLN